MKAINFQSIKPHLLALVGFLMLCCAYYYPQVGGKVLNQVDLLQAKGMQGEVRQFDDEIGRRPLWTNAIFSGMPAYHMAAGMPQNAMTWVYRTTIGFDITNPIFICFISMFSMYLLLSVLGLPPPLSFIGGAAFGLSTITIILVEAGHVTKIAAIGYMPFFLAGLILLYNSKYRWGFIVTAVGFCMQLMASHLQITYYLFLISLVFGLSKLISTIQSGDWQIFAKASILAVLAVLLGLTPHVSRLWTNYEFSQETIRGGHVLTQTDTENQSEGGLDKSYAYQWSYGIAESFNFLIPNFMGGPSVMELDKNSETYNAIKSKAGASQASGFIKQVPTYWGDQPFTSGPFYFGAALLFLAILGLLFSKSKAKWWLFSAFVLTVAISWGKNFSGFNYLLFDYFPMFNKFRAFSSVLSASHMCVVVLAILGLKSIYDADEKERERYFKPTLITGGVLAGICVFFAFFGSAFFNFESAGDARLAQNPWLIDAIIEDRIGLLTSDALRSTLIIGLTLGGLWLLFTEKIKKEFVAIFLGVVIVGDLWTVGKRFVDADSFVSERKYDAAKVPSAVDVQILKDKELGYRVFNLAGNTFNESMSAFHHRNVGGYNAAKLRRYQDLIDGYLSKNDPDVLNMLNTKYVIIPNEQGGKQVQENPLAQGVAWAASEFVIAANHDDEFAALENTDLATTAIIHEDMSDYIAKLLPRNAASAEIEMTRYIPDDLAYSFKSDSEQLVVFSEIWYNPAKGWQAYIDGQPVDHIRANYVLRALRVPAGEHLIEFKFMPTSVSVGGKIEFLGGLLLLLLIIGGIGLELKGGEGE